MSNRRLPSSWTIVSVLFLLAFITIVDRVCISAAKNDIAAELAIPDLSFGVVFGAFAIGYAICMVPSGWAGDILGPRRFLTVIVCLWSLLTILTGFARSLAWLIGIRLLFGGAEAGAFPTAARALSGWLPLSRRGLALGLLNTGSRLGAAIGLSLVSVSITRWGWRVSFAALGTAGFLWSVGWYTWYRDRDILPLEPHPVRARSDSLSRPAPMSLNEAIVSRNSAFLLAQYFASNFTFFICFSWLLPYLRSRFGLSAEQAGVYASIPLYFGTIATWTSGWTVDWLYRSGNVRLSRRLPAMAGFSIAAAGLVAAAFTPSPQSFVLFFAITTFGVDFTLSPSWTSCADIAGVRTGTLSGAMNALGSLGSFASSICFPWLLSLTGDVKAYFFGAAMINVLAAVCWWRFNANDVDLPL